MVRLPINLTNYKQIFETYSTFIYIMISVVTVVLFSYFLLPKMWKKYIRN